MHIVLDMIGYVCVLDTYGYVWICSASFWIRLDTVLDTSAFWICLDTFEYVWICLDTLSFGYACACPVLDTFGYGRRAVNLGLECRERVCEKTTGRAIGGIFDSGPWGASFLNFRVGVCGASLYLQKSASDALRHFVRASGRTF